MDTPAILTPCLDNRSASTSSTHRQSKNIPRMAARTNLCLNLSSASLTPMHTPIPTVRQTGGGVIPLISPPMFLPNFNIGPRQAPPPQTPPQPSGPSAAPPTPSAVLAPSTFDDSMEVLPDFQSAEELLVANGKDMCHMF
uniref:Uncharacterized protein n=1 Tax=Corethron hystrix TaxID=216773 RepID=A0A7S1B8X9_9STRA